MALLQNALRWARSSTLLFKLPLGALVCVACAGVLGIEDATCSDEFSGCPGFDEGDAGDGDGDGDGDQDAGEVDLCDEYCGEVTDNCVDENEQYPSYDFCMGVCPHIHPGEPGDVDVNSVHCRLLRARAAADSETDLNCQVAGPGGDGVCDSKCKVYCDFMFEVCAEEFATRDECEQECEELDDVGFYTSQITQGQDLQCRIYHVNAATGDPVFHCPHAAGAGPCDTPRE